MNLELKLKKGCAVTSADMLWLALQQRGMQLLSLRHSLRGKGNSSCQVHVGKGTLETKPNYQELKVEAGNRDFINRLVSFSSRDELRPKTHRVFENQTSF